MLTALLVNASFTSTLLVMTALAMKDINK